MANDGQPGIPSLTIAPLKPADTALVIVEPQFLQAASDLLGDHLTPDDGFDELLNDPLSLIDSESASVDSLAPVASDVAATPGAFTPDNLSAIAHDLATFNGNGDTITTTFGIATTPPGQPDPSTEGFSNAGGGDGGNGLPPPPRPDQGNPDAGGVLPPHVDSL
jgi:hypothetical protein